MQQKMLQCVKMALPLGAVCTTDQRVSSHRVRPIRKKPNKAPQSTRRKFNNRNNTGSESRSVPWQLNVNSPCAGVRFYGHLRYRLSLFFRLQ